MQQLKLRILLVSDIHHSDENINKLLQREMQNEIDLVLLLGDYLNIYYDLETDYDDQKYCDALSTLLEPFTHLKCPVYMIPGNHDPKSLFTGNQLNLNNIHGQVVQIAEQLHLVGLGGSVPGYKNGQQHWHAYPYMSEAELSAEWNKIDIPKQGQVLLMTHVGPHISSTTISHEEEVDQPIHSGSTTLSEYLLNNNNIVCNVHGHTHDGVGYRYIKGQHIINAGPLVHGNYTKITLIRNQLNWKIDSIEHTLL